MRLDFSSLLCAFVTSACCAPPAEPAARVRRIVIATPHYYHTTIAIAAIGAGLNVLTEKPLSVHKADCEKVIEAFENRPDKSKIFSEMFNQRTDNTCEPSPLRPARYAQPLRAVRHASC